MEKLRSELLPPEKNNSGNGIWVASAGMVFGGSLLTSMKSLVPYGFSIPICVLRAITQFFLMV